MKEILARFQLDLLLDIMILDLDNEKKLDLISFVL